jgi:hypothetical protein
LTAVKYEVRGWEFVTGTTGTDAQNAEVRRE